MMKLDWLETFEMGIPEIDNDHREMLAIMKRVEAAADAEDFTQCGSLLDKLVDFSMAHFKREEDLLETAGYPNIGIHREYHSGLIARAGTMKEICKGIRSRENIKDCCMEMFKFLVDDIVAGDLNFKSFLQDKGVIKPR